jgi:hypothetical protein
MRSGNAAAAVLVLLTVGTTVLVGCSAPPTTSIDFNGPPGSIITIDHKPYQLPATIALARPREAGKTVRQDVELYVPAVPSASGPRLLDSEGIIDIFGYNETDVDRLATNTCNFGNDDLNKVLDGYAVIFDGTSPSGQKLYHMILGKKKRVSEAPR